MALLSLVRPSYGLLSIGRPFSMLSLPSFLILGAYIYLAVMFYFGKRGALPAVGFLVLTAAALLSLLYHNGPLSALYREFLGVRTLTSSSLRAILGPFFAETIYRWEQDGIPFYNNFQAWYHTLLYAAGFASAAAASLLGERGRKLRFVPPACILVSTWFLLSRLLRLWNFYDSSTYTSFSFIGQLFRIVLTLAVCALLAGARSHGPRRPHQPV